MAATTQKGPTKQSVSAVQHWRAQQATATASRLGGLLLLLLVWLLLVVPSPILGYHWRAVVFGPIAHVVLAPFPTPEMGLPAFVPVAPVVQWVAWLWCVLAGYGGCTLLQHLLLLHAQTVAPLKKPRTFYQVRLPASATVDKAQGVGLLRSLHGMLPAVHRAGAPLVLRWSGLPDQPIQQGVSLLLPDTARTSVVKTLEGIAPGTLVEAVDDPFLAALTPGRHLAWCDLRLSAGDAVPLAIPPRDQSPLLEGLLPALAPPAGVVATDMQLILRPVAQMTAWRLKVLATAERLKVDVQSNEQKVIDKKAEGPGFDTTIRLLVLADTAALAIGYLAVIADTFAATAQTSGTRQQRLRATKSRCVALHEAQPRPARPVLQSVPDARNPAVVPLIGAWLGHQPRILSAAELATLWAPPTERTAARIARIPARWLPVPADAFVDATNPKNLILGHGLKADGSWSPIGLPYDHLRYVLWMTAPMGRGKSVWLQHLFCGLMRADAGCLLLDCKGTDLVKDSLPLVPLSRERDVTVLQLGGTAITGEDLRVSMNMLSPTFGGTLGLDHSMLASFLLSFFATLDPRFDEAVGIQQFAKMGLLALLEGEPNATLLHLTRFFSDEAYRDLVVSRIDNLPVQDFWSRRFPALPDSQKSSLAAFERRLDLLLTFPELQAMLVAPGCSINLRQMMDHRGILMAGIKATEGQIAAMAGTLLLTQMTLAALSRDNLPVAERQHWPVIIDEAQIIFGQNPGMAKVMFSQLRAFHIGQVVVHQGVRQLPDEVLTPLADNAQFRVILGAEPDDASRYGSQWRATGVSAADFMNMERFQHQYTKFLGTSLFSSRMRPMPEPLHEAALPPVDHDWRTVQAPVTSEQDRQLDALQAELRSLLHENTRETVRAALHKLGTLCQQRPDTFNGYCVRTRAHRLAQRQFLLDHPGAISDKVTRIRVLSALQSGIPRLESAALQYALIKETGIAAEAAARAGAGEKRGRGKGQVVVQEIAGISRAPDDAGETPIIDDLRSATAIKQERGRRRSAADDHAEGFDDSR